MPVSTTPNDPAAPQTLATAGLPRRVRSVLERALALVSDELDRSLNAMLVEYEQQLFQLADHARNPGVESSYMQTLRTMRMNRADLVPRFMLSLETSLAGLRNPQASMATTSGGHSVSFRNMSLVEETVMDEDTILREIATRQEARASLALHLLGQRFGVLAGAPAFDAERIPLGPQALCRAMRDASRGLQIAYDARLLLYRTFDHKVMASYGIVVEALDGAMAADGILPGLTHVPVRTRAPTAVTAPGEESAGGTQGQAGAKSAGSGSGISGSGDSGSGTPGSGGGAGAGGGGRGGAASGRASRPHPSNDPQRPHTAWMGEVDDDPDNVDEDAAFGMLQQLLTGRRELIGKLRPGGPQPAKHPLSPRDVDSALGALQRAPQSPTGAPRSLLDVKQTLLAQARQQRGHGAALSPQDNDTFELLGLLYGQIESEIRTDAPATALIRRLQLPLLRVALQDRGFFVRTRHPARQLLNTVAENAAKWLDADDFDPQLLAPLQQAVTHVVEKYDGDNAVFENSNQTLQTHLQAQVRKSEMLERRHIEAARGKEKLEVAKLRASETLATVIGDQPLPKFVRALLNQAWADVLTLTLLRQGDDSAEWQKQLEATRKIVAACGKGGAPVDPLLASHIENALTQVGYHADEAGVIAQRLTSSKSDEDDPASRTELAMKLKARTRLGEDAAKARKPMLPPRTPEEQARYDQLRVMPFGTWIEFVTNQQGDAVRRRLSWYSPVTDNALFVNQRGQRVGEQSLDSLARMVTHGQARIVTAERARLVDRAWQAALNALRSFAGTSEDNAVPEGAQ